jgi:UDP-3-O-[3-hydroxymyristoyl] N-acetylglucosamine deacetylase
MALLPAAPGSGIVFVRSDLTDIDNRIPAESHFAGGACMSTGLVNAAGARVDTVEHLMAALAGLEIDNAIIEVNGPEVPIMDGSSAPFVALLQNVGLRAQAAPRRWIEILERVYVEDGDRWAALEPCETTQYDLTIVYGDSVIGRQRFVYEQSRQAFLNDIAEARTYGFLRDADRLRAAGRAIGSSEDNTIVIDENKVLNAKGLLFEDEFVRHKVLDAIGDLVLLGSPILGRYVAHQPGHGLNSTLRTKLLATPEAWRIVADESVGPAQAFANA